MLKVLSSRIVKGFWEHSLYSLGCFHSVVVLESPYMISSEAHYAILIPFLNVVRSEAQQYHLTPVDNAENQSGMLGHDREG